MRTLPILAALVASLALSAFASRAVDRAIASNTLTRPEDPVVLTGADVPSFGGIAPNLLVAFKHNGSTWVQVPVQVDERDYKDFRTIYNNGVVAAGTTSLQYSDANTWAGADSNPTIDANDEIVFMAKDADGVAPGFSEPPSVVPGSGVRVTVTDPLHPGQTGYVYLFRQTGVLDPGAGTVYVVYSFQLDPAADYKTTYNFADGPNPENSLAFSGAYAYHFGDRWQDDELIVTAGSATGVDILDRHKPMFAPGNCIRTEETFDDAEGAFVANKSGPVRAIRSYIGANSGPLTQREHVFYAERQDIRTFLRVHAIASIMDLMDYNVSAVGMSYYNNLNISGALIDGNPETPTAGAITWEAINGAQGAVIQAGSVSTNIPSFAYTSYYLDDSTPPVTQCTGDGFAYGTSGTYVNTTIPSTDPSIGGTNFLNTVRSMYFKAPYASGSAAVAAAQAAALQAATPLEFVIEPFTAGGDSDSDGIADAADNCPADSNPLQENNDRNFVSNAPSYGINDTTWINSDNAGDACDADDDNDGIVDASEAAGCGGAGPSNPLLRDTDGDRVLDGAECALGTNPTVGGPGFTPTGANCATLLGVVAITDTDGDKIKDYIEFCYYGSDRLLTDTDGDTALDGAKDGCEIASMNTDRIVSSGDQGMLAAGISGAADYHPNIDLDKSGGLNSGDQGLMASFIVPAGQCP